MAREKILRIFCQKNFRAKTRRAESLFGSASPSSSALADMTYYTSAFAFILASTPASTSAFASTLAPVLAPALASVLASTFAPPFAPAAPRCCFGARTVMHIAICPDGVSIPPQCHFGTVSVLAPAPLQHSRRYFATAFTLTNKKHLSLTLRATDLPQAHRFTVTNWCFGKHIR